MTAAQKDLLERSLRGIFSATEIETNYFVALVHIVWQLSILEDLLKELIHDGEVSDTQIQNSLKGAADKLGNLEVHLQHISCLFNGPDIDPLIEAGRAARYKYISAYTDRYEKDRRSSQYAELI